VKTKTTKKTKRKKSPATPTLGVRELRAVEQELAALSKRAKAPPRWNADPDDVQRSVIKLVLTLVEFLRQLMERQAIRRMDARTLSPAEIERVGTALMRLEETVADLARRFDIDPDDLNLELGPLGTLM